MYQWMADLVNAAFSPLRTAVYEIVARFTSLWATITGFWYRTRDEFGRWYTYGRNWATSQVNHAISVLVTLQWIVTSYVPRRLSILADIIVQWTLDQISSRVNAVLGALAAFRDWTISQLNAAITLANGIWHWVDAHVSLLEEATSRLLDRVFNTWANPKRLALWLVGAMFEALLRYAIDNAVPIGRALWGARAQVTAENLDKAEDIFVRII